MMRLKPQVTEQQLLEIGFTKLDSGIIHYLMQDELVHIHILVDLDKTVEFMVRTKDNYKVMIMDYVLTIIGSFLALVEEFDEKEVYINQYRL